jgi:hypothetical protein
VGFAGRADLLDGHLGHEIQLPNPSGLKALGVKGDTVMLFGFESEDLGGDMLDSMQEFAVAGQKEGSIGAGELYCNFWRGIGGGGGFGGCEA